MIVRILSRGSSFQGLTTYLTHDAEANTAERVDWTHTLNCANDHVPAAVNEMLWTARDAELLKQEAGIRAGGRATESTVKHLSLNWAPDERPTREHMIATTEDFLRQMGWDEHQALLVAHNDKSYAHVHVMLNVVHPETGLKLDDNFERRRAQSWAKEYEREHGGIRCENRLRNIGEREPAPTRPAWQAFQGVRRDFDHHENIREAEADRDGAETGSELRGPAQEWEILKKMQRDERLGFFAEGKIAFAEMRNAVYREVREEFRDRWAEYYAEKRDGADPTILRELKTNLVNDQKAMLEDRRDGAYRELRNTRDGLYQELLMGQREQRQELSARQASGFDSLDLMDCFRTDRPRASNDNGRDATYEFPVEAAKADEDYSYFSSAGGERSALRSPLDAGSRVCDGIAMGVLKICDFLADSISPPSPQPQKRQPEPDTYFAEAAAEARLREQIDRDRARAREDDEERQAREKARSRQ